MFIRYGELMKKLYYLSFFALSIVHALTMQPSHPEPTKLFLGAVQFPEHLEDNLCLYYKGQKLTGEWNKNNTTAQFSFLDSKYTQEIFIVICDNFSYQTSQTNTVQYLQTTSNNYKCYKLQAYRSCDENNSAKCSWSVQEQELEKNIIPDNSLIFLFNPNFVEGLQVHSWSADHSMRTLPTIKIKNIQAKDLARTMTITRLTAIDIDVLHSKALPKGS